ncbi:hypothetical protein I3843_14G098400 [Carya illinoinensis]|nr:hypothetical protein I3843_14G098400 [Carya illinoinensis]KAG7947502.1 hypothetical protein I3843_14G098400 [Carya illinoinensis]KAG7947503.1 hypothetical protein I3843_14G098400 [Carya illinoinensis]
MEINYDNYADWSARIKSYVDWSARIKKSLLAQGLWDIIETAVEPPKPEDDIVEFEAWRKRNNDALLAIQSSCGIDILSQIKNISSAKIVWDKLDEMFKQPWQGLIHPHTPTQITRSANQIVEEENSSSNPGRGMDTVPEDSFKTAVRNGYWYFISEILDRDLYSDSYLTGRITLTGGTVLHAAVAAQKENIVEKLVDKMSEHDLAIQDNRGYTALHAAIAVAAQKENIVEKLVDKMSEDDLAIQDNRGYTALHAAIAAQKENIVQKLVDKMSKHDLAIQDNRGYTALHAAVAAQKENIVQKLVEKMSEHDLAIQDNRGYTALHAAVAAQKENIMQRLVHKMSEHDLPIQDNRGYTALHAAVAAQKENIVERLIEKNNSLISIRTDSKDLLVVMAMRCGHKQLASLLYSHTRLGDLEAEQGRQGSALLTYAIYARHFGIALRLISCSPRLAFALHQDQNLSPLNALATFQSDKNQLTIRELANYSLVPQDILLALWRSAFRCLLKLDPGIERLILRRSKLFNILERFLPEDLRSLRAIELENGRFKQLLSRICREIPTFNQSDHLDRIIAPAIFCAISKGNFEFVSRMLKANPEFLWIRNDEGMSIFHYAVLHRQAQIFSLVYGLKGRVEDLLAERDKSGNTILHLAGMLPEHTVVDKITGAAFQMEREVEWFKEVESICQPITKEFLNNKGLNPTQVFRITHQNLREGGERWMKETTTSGLVAATLIVTIMFTAAFTFPGGNDQDTGLPVLINDTKFRIFMTFLPVLTKAVLGSSFGLSMFDKNMKPLF